MSDGDLLLPDQVFGGRYRVIRTLASGGMGMVFEAEHIATEQRVALKLLLPHVVQLPSARERFSLEAKFSARIKSEHVVQMLDAGLDEATRSPYLVMELLEGETLAQRVERSGPLRPAEVVTFLRQVASGLDVAHSLRDPSGKPSPVVHRDLKPENLVLARRADGSPLMKILDFGIAKILSESRNMSQEVRGTPLYMAAEQVAARPLSAQTDIWSLGLIAYYLLTGKCYWRSADDPDAGIAAVFAEILTLPMLPASVRMREQGLSLQLPHEFDVWLARCLDREASGRFPSAARAIDELERALGPRPAPRTLDERWSTGNARAGGAPPVGRRSAAPATSGSLAAIATAAQGRARTPGSGRLRVVLASGALVSLIAGALVGWRLRMSTGSFASGAAPPASSGSVQVQEKRVAPPKQASQALPALPPLPAATTGGPSISVIQPVAASLPPSPAAQPSASSAQSLAVPSSAARPALQPVVQPERRVGSSGARVVASAPRVVASAVDELEPDPFNAIEPPDDGAPEARTPAVKPPPAKPRPAAPPPEPPAARPAPVAPEPEPDDVFNLR